MSKARDSAATSEVRKQIAGLEALGWYHSIQLPGGEVIPGLQTLEQLRKRIAQFPIPQDLRGKRVLDIGAWDGWFSFEMERRGAEVVAVDRTEQTRFLEAKRLLGSKVEYRISDVLSLTPATAGTFDIVLFLGVLYHVKHPLLALERVCALSREMVCVESFISEALSAIPLMEFYENSELCGQFDNWVGPNRACLLALCRAAGFCESELGKRDRRPRSRDLLPNLARSGRAERRGPGDHCR
jgi:tRNA (mo5U34)-methyltransferase